MKVLFQEQTPKARNPIISLTNALQFWDARSGERRPRNGIFLV
jgi:hypothetical protein